MQTVLFVPGFKEDIDSRDYRKTIASIEAAGYAVTFVPITWERTTITQWVAELDAVYKTYDPATTILAGFSFGAMTAMVCAATQNPAALWLFSLSPYFSEDQAASGFKKSWRSYIGHRRADSFKALQFSTLLKNISCDVIFFYGEEELKTYPDITYRHTAVRRLAHATEILIPGAKHDVSSGAYVEAISRTVKVRRT